ncbi:MAG: malate synthase A [Rhodothermaceae bacterium]|nr:malate synthase A [Rhodothermaceae bacterium]
MMTVFEPLALGNGVTIHAPACTDTARRLVHNGALDLVVRLHRALNAERRHLLAARVERQKDYDAGILPGFLPDEEHPAAHGDWQIAPLPNDLLRRRVEITGPVSDTKMVINMLSRTAGGQRADAAMLDFEDSMKPSWANVMAGIENVMGAVRGDLTYTKLGPDGEALKVYRLNPDDMPLLMVRVRGLHLDESNIRVDDQPVSGGLFDFALTAYYTARALLKQGKTPKFYVPKVEHYLEARWWSRLFSLTEQALGLDHGTIKATFLIETLPAAFQMEEILYEFREHAAGLNGGRWDKIFSDIKCLQAHPDRVLADRATIGMNRPWMADYAKQLIRVCHARGAFAMGGMAAFTPGRDPAAREQQTAKVVADKEFEAGIGHDGCWVSHPYFIGPAMQPFLDKLDGDDNQLDVIPDLPAQPDLLPKGTGPRTLDGLRTNVRVGIAYLKGWNEDIGCVAWDDLMEDLATLEISRAQVGQWLRHLVTLDPGSEPLAGCGALVTPECVRRVFAEETETILDEIREAMEAAPMAAIHREVAAYRRAADEAEAIFLERPMRPFLSLASDLVPSVHAGDGARTSVPSSSVTA